MDYFLQLFAKLGNLRVNKSLLTRQYYGMLDVREDDVPLQAVRELLIDYEAKVRNLESLLGRDRSAALQECEAVFNKIQELRNSS